MLEVRLHGRGGQGVVTSAELLSVAAFWDGKQAQAFPSFGSERTGAPVVAFVRINDAPIRLREPVTRPDAVIVGDATLLHRVDVFAGLGPDGFVLINSARTLEELGLSDLVERHERVRLATVAATALAREHTGRPLPGVCLLGALAGLTGWVTLAGLERAVGERFDAAVASGNLAAAAAAYQVVQRGALRA